MNIPIGLQLYTLREEMEKDFIGVLEKVADIGYKGVEFAGYGDFSAEELKDHLDRLGLKACGSHVAYNEIVNNIEEVIEYNLKIDNKYIICPYMEYEGKKDFIKVAEKLNEAGKRCKEKGLQLCYHNHSHEFETFDGEYGLDLIYENSNPDYLQAEIDTFWVKVAGLDPVTYVKKYTDRAPLVHLKDMENEENKDFAEVGNGIMDIKSIAEAATDAKANWLVVEQDQCKRPPLESVKISFDNLKEMGLV